MTDSQRTVNVPSGWRNVRLKQTIEVCRNGVWGSEPEDGDAVPCVRVADFDRTTNRVCDEIPTLRSFTDSELAGRVLDRDDLLLEKSGGGELQPVGFVVSYDRNERAVCSNFVARMPPARGYDSRFICYVHAHLYAGRVNERSIKQTTGIQNLDATS